MKLLMKYTNKASLSLTAKGHSLCSAAKWGTVECMLQLVYTDCGFKINWPFRTIRGWARFVSAGSAVNPRVWKTGPWYANFLFHPPWENQAVQFPHAQQLYSLFGKYWHIWSAKMGGYFGKFRRESVSGHPSPDLLCLDCSISAICLCS